MDRRFGHLSTMRRASLATLLVVLALLGCNRREETAGSGSKPAIAATGGGPALANVPAAPGSTALLAGATCAFPAKLDGDFVLKAGCVVDLQKSVLVGYGRMLTIEPGVTLRFHADTFLEVGHQGSRIVARGTKDKPIVFTSAASSPKAGDWVGIVFDDSVGKGSTIEHAVIEYAGRATHGGQAAITLLRPPKDEGRVAIRETTLRHNQTAAISARHGNGGFAAFEKNTFVDNERALRVVASVLAGLGEGNDIDGEIEVIGGAITGKGVFPMTKGGIHVTEPIQVDGTDDAPASLTLAKGAVLRFAPKTWLEIGTGGPAELTANGVTLTSDSKTPKAGDWVGLLFGDKTKRAKITDTTIEYAGAEEHGGDAAVTFVGSKSWQAHDVHFAGVTFKSIQQAHFSSNGDGCNKALDPKYGIVWSSAEPCR